MATFAIQRGPTPLFTWDVETGTGRFSDRAVQRGGLLMLGELESRTFVLDPAGEDEYRISIGDIPVSEVVGDAGHAGGFSIQGQRIWPEYAYFESARGETLLRVEVRKPGAKPEIWELLLEIVVYVVSTKLGEEAYQAMVDELQVLSRSLLVDLYGKSRRTYDLRFAREGRSFHSREEELEAIGSVVERLSVLLPAIERRPASRVVRQVVATNYWGSERLSSIGMISLAQRGMSVEASPRPVPIFDARMRESFDIPEHRLLNGFLGNLTQRLSLCARAAAEHMLAVEQERPLRDIRFNEGPSLYESMDVPKLSRLRDAQRKAERLRELVRGMVELPFLQEVPAQLAPVRGGMFQRSHEYRELFHVIRNFLAKGALEYEGDDFAGVTKLTSRLFEQWCFLRIINAFRAAGVELREWTETLRDYLPSRFLLDFDRGLQFEGLLGGKIRLRFRYEPWILGEEAAARAGETLCRVSTQNVAWSPDVMIECLLPTGDTWEAVYAIVLDSKYVSRIHASQWNATRKYFQIRSTRSKRQVVRQLWLLWPGGSPEIVSEDPAVTFSSGGPSCVKDESVMFTLAAPPLMIVNQAGNTPVDDVFRLFAEGTLSFLRRELS